MPANKKRKVLAKELELAREQLEYIDTSNFDASKLATFDRRKRIIDLYIEDKRTLKEISIITNSSVSEIKRIVKRFLTLNENGMPYGYSACIPHSPFKQYTKSSSEQGGNAGLFSHFLAKYPLIQEKLEDWALGNLMINGSVIRGKRYLRIYEAFRSLCQECGIDLEKNYPFTNTDGGLDAIRNYCILIKNLNPNKGVIVNYGDDAGRLYNISKINVDPTLLNRPYDVVELDGHKIDAQLIIEIINELGDVNDLLLSRIWILCLIDVISKAILGYSISLLHNYSSIDVLDCVGSALLKPEPQDTRYGLPCTEIKGCESRLFNVIKLDNAYAHTSPWVHEKLIEIGIQEIILNRPKRPRSNNIIERFYGTFEELSGHRLSSTTGSKPEDVRRRNPEKAALKHKVTLEVIEKAAQKAIAEYNSSPHSGLNGSTPLDYLKYCIQKEQDFIRQIPESDQDQSPFYMRKFPITIRGDLSIGKYPYIQFKGATYSSEVLKKSPELINKKATIEIDSRDIRFAKLFLENGHWLDKLIVERRWQYHPHTIRTRQALLRRYRDKKKSHLLNSSNPIESYFAEILDKSKKSKKHRNDLARLSRETEIPIHKLDNHKSTSTEVIPSDYKVTLNLISKY